eukprot:SAG31_NODE_5120_length_2728_cov_1.448840_2_plen_38_part_00
MILLQKTNDEVLAKERQSLDKERRSLGEEGRLCKKIQ